MLCSFARTIIVRVSSSFQETPSMPTLAHRYWSMKHVSSTLVVSSLPLRIDIDARMSVCALTQLHCKKRKTSIFIFLLADKWNFFPFYLSYLGWSMFSTWLGILNNLRYCSDQSKTAGNVSISVISLMTWWGSRFLGRCGVNFLQCIRVDEPMCVNGHAVSTGVGFHRSSTQTDCRSIHSSSAFSSANQQICSCSN